MSTNIKNPIDGWLIIDKPYGMGSTDVVGKLKWSLSPTKIGHAGTLDPLATGVLPIALGKATKLIPYVMDGTKVYEFQITWGAETETDDAEGSVTATSDKRPTEAEVREVLNHFVGVIEQVPPAYSALKVGGQRAYDLARAGEEVSLKARAVRVDSLELLSFCQDCADFRVVCGKGTYVRSLGRDIGRALGCLGYISVLRRVACGPFLIKDAVDLLQFQEKQVNVAVIPMDFALKNMPVLVCTNEMWQRLKQGQRLSLKNVTENLRCLAEDTVIRMVWRGELVGLAKIKHGGIHPYRILA